MNKKSHLILLYALVLQTTLFLPALFAQQAPPGYRSYKNREHGLSWFVRKSFSPLPPQPNEEEFLAKFVKGVKSKASKKGLIVTGRPQIWLVTFGPLVEEKDEAPADKNEPPRTRPISLEEEAEKRLREFVKRRFRKSFLKEVNRIDADSKKPLRIYFELYKSDPDKFKGKPKNRPKPSGLLRLWCEPKDIILFAGICYRSSDYRACLTDFKKAAASLENLEGVESTGDDFQAKMEDYISKGWKDPQHRVDVEKALVKGWKAINTEHYIIIHHTRDKAFLSRISKRLEIIHKYYEELFPPAEPVEEAATVRVCKDRNEYIAYGGHPSSAGYWYYKTKELVLYNSVKGRQGSRLGKKDTLIVLFHEAFHQYIHYATGGVAPHIWYNEGFADYFSGIYMSGPKVKEVRVNLWRVNRIKELVKNGQYWSIEKLIKAHKAEYYFKGGDAYAQGWSFVRFLQHGKALRKFSHWKRILPTYFDTLQRDYRESLSKLEPEKKEDPKIIMPLQERARKVALDEAFEGVDLDLLEKHWKTFVLKMKKVSLPKR